MQYSLIVATYNRLGEMKELIDSMGQLETADIDFELVVVDDGSTDGTRTYIEGLNTHYPILYEYQENKGPGAARNKAMGIARGDYFIFIDSDVILPSHYLSSINRSIEGNNWDAFGGPDDCHPSFPPLLKAINYSMTSFIGTGGTRGSKKSVDKFYPRSFNMGIRKEIYQDIGGMSDLRHGQDMDYSARIYGAGYKVGLIPEAVVFHKRRTSLKKFFKQIFNWGVTRINLGRRYPEMLKPIHLLPALIVTGLILILGLGIFLPVFRLFIFVILVLGLLVSLFAFFQSLYKYRSIKVAFLSIITLNIQVLAYGLGTISGLWQWLIGKKEVKGFTKNYYN